MKKRQAPRVGDLVEVRVDSDWHRVVVVDPRAIVTGYSPADLPAGAKWWRFVKESIDGAARDRLDPDRGKDAEPAVRCDYCSRGVRGATRKRALRLGGPVFCSRCEREKRQST